MDDELDSTSDHRFARTHGLDVHPASADDSYYVGSTRNLEGRLWQHQNGKAADYTRHRLPVTLVYACECENVGQAFWLEKRVQSWSRRKREALIRGEFEALPGLAKKDFGKRSRRPQ